MAKLKKVLVADHNESFVEFLGSILSKEGCQVSAAYDGKEAIEKMTQDPPDLLFLDLVLPKIDGWKLIDCARNHRDLQDMKIAVVSDILLEDPGVSRRVKANFFVAKGPIEGMAEKISTVLGKIKRNEIEKEALTIGLESIRPREVIRELLSSTKHYQAILNDIDKGVVIFDTDLKILDANLAAGVYFNKSSTELINQGVCSLFNSEYAERISQILKKLRERHECTEEPLTIQHGPKVFKITFSAFVSDVDHGFQGGAVLIEDITDLSMLAITDGLTSLYNKRHFYVQLQKEIERAKRYNSSLSLLMADVDHFKNYNDTYGHLEGDGVLRRLGATIKANIRTIDSAYRYGGEEFAIILPETRGKNGLVVAERIRKVFANIDFSPKVSEDKVDRVHKTISIGVAELMPDYTIEDLVNCADKAMYEAKRAGRNQTFVYA